MRQGRRVRARRRSCLGLGASLLLVLVLACRSGGEAAAPPPPKTAAKRATAPPAAGVGHVVRPGDTLWSISRRYGVSLDALVRANHLQPRQRLRIGQRLTIPGSAPIEKGRQEPPSLAEIVLAPPPEPRVQLLWPVTGPVGSPFGPRGNVWHGGMDIRVNRGTAIRAAAAGMVISGGTERGYGHVIKIWHANDLMTVYAHNQENLVKVGDWVERGQVIGIVGQTGRATAPHLHFEVRLDGKKYNPLFWLPPPGTVDVATTSPGLNAAAAP